MKIILTNQNSGQKTTFMAILALLGPFLLLGGGLVGCNEKPSDDSKARIIATTGMVADIARNVVGDRGAVSSIMGEGTDPHLYTPTRSDVVKLMDADIVLYNGLMLEGKMTDVLGRLDESGTTVCAVAEAMNENSLLGWTGAGASDGNSKHHDPHVWMDVRGWMTAVEAARDAIISHDPAGAEFYKTNTEKYLADLAALDDYARQSLSTVPKERRVLVTAHDAFNYFGRAYDVEVRAIQGISTESEAGVRDINDLVAFIVARKISAVFVESSVADKYVKALIEGAQSHRHDVRIGGTLYSDAMGPTGSWEGTYLGMIDHNVTTITNALGGTAPEGGFRQWRKQQGMP